MGTASDLDAAPDSHPEKIPFAAPNHLFHLFTTIARLRDARLDKALKSLGLNVTRHRAIAVIALLEPCTMSDLADLSAIDRTTMTRIVDQLVGKGFAKRAVPTADRRQVLITLTDEGRKVHGAALRVIAEVNRLALAGLSDELVRSMAEAERAILFNLSPSAEKARRFLAFSRS